MKDYCYSLGGEIYGDLDRAYDDFENDIGIVSDEIDTITFKISRGESQSHDHRDFIYVDSILENIGEAAYDVGHEWADDYASHLGCFKNEAAKKELEDFINDWLVKHAEPVTFFSVINTEDILIIIGEKTNSGGVIFHQPHGSLTRE